MRTLDMSWTFAVGGWAGNWSALRPAATELGAIVVQDLIALDRETAMLHQLARIGADSLACLHSRRIEPVDNRLDSERGMVDGIAGDQGVVSLAAEVITKIGSDLRQCSGVARRRCCRVAGCHPRHRIHFAGCHSRHGTHLAGRHPGHCRVHGRVARCGQDLESNIDNERADNDKEHERQDDLAIEGKTSSIMC